MTNHRSILSVLAGAFGMAQACVAQSTSTERIEFDESMARIDPIVMEFGAVSVAPSRVISARLTLRASQASSPDELQLFDAGTQDWVAAFSVSGSGWQTYLLPIDSVYYDEIAGGLDARLVVNYSATFQGTMIDYAELSVEYQACLADIDYNGFVNGDDYDLFASAFDAADPAADLDANGFVNGDDYDLFASAFESGC
ncbi:MAG: hypothetical protein IT434_00245 [Phycisphaerales bacterium]|jgi:hypothetical protein|nr:hypothetical protein [Phycisphaerales bacterium]